MIPSFEDNERRNSPTLRVNALDNRSPLTIARLDQFWGIPPLRCRNNLAGSSNPHLKACFVEVVDIVLRDPILVDSVAYEPEPPLNNLRILALGSLVIVLAGKTCFELWSAFNKVCGLVYANMAHIATAL